MPREMPLYIPKTASEKLLNLINDPVFLSKEFSVCI